MAILSVFFPIFDHSEFVANARPDVSLCRRRLAPARPPRASSISGDSGRIRRRSGRGISGRGRPTSSLASLAQGGRQETRFKQEGFAGYGRIGAEECRRSGRTAVLFSLFLFSLLSVPVSLFNFFFLSFSFLFFEGGGGGALFYLSSSLFPCSFFSLPCSLFLAFLLFLSFILSFSPAESMGGMKAKKREMKTDLHNVVLNMGITMLVLSTAVQAKELLKS